MDPLVPLDTTKLKYFYIVVKKCYNDFSFFIDNISGLVTDSAPTIVDQRKGLVK